MPETEQSARDYWEQRYGEKDRIWSGHVNVQLATVVADLSPGRALDLGCGEGADTIWLAEHGWQVTAVDIAVNALQRARDQAKARGVADRIDFTQCDLSDDFPSGTFDLVSAQFLHSTVRLERPTILRNAAQAVGPGGVLLIVDHAAAPPWAKAIPHDFHFPSPTEVLAGLDLPAERWDRVQVETIDRTVTDPDGNPATLQDNLMVLRRKKSAAAGR